MRIGKLAAVVLVSSLAGPAAGESAAPFAPVDGAALRPLDSTSVRPDEELSARVDEPLHPEDLDGHTLRELHLLRAAIETRHGGEHRVAWLHRYFGDHDGRYPYDWTDMSNRPAVHAANADLIERYLRSLPVDDLDARYRTLRQRHGHADLSYPRSVAFSPDGRRVAVAKQEDDVVVVNLATGEREHELSSYRLWGDHDLPPHDVTVQFVGPSLLLARTYSGRMVTWDLRSGRERWGRGPLEDPSAEPEWYQQVVTPRSHVVLMGGPGIEVTDARTGKRLRRLHREEVAEMAVSADGQTIVALDHGDQVKVWDLRSSGPARKLPTREPVYGLEVSGDGSRVALLYQKQVEVRAVGKNASRMLELDAIPGALELDRTGRRLVVRNAEGITLWDTTTGEPLWTQAFEDKSLNDLYEPVFSPDGAHVAFTEGESVFLLQSSDGAMHPVFARSEDWPDEDTRIEASLLARHLGRADFADATADRDLLDDPRGFDRRITGDRLGGYGRRELRILRNAIFARRGKPYTSNTLRWSFEHRSWYQPDDAFTPDRLTAVDRHNIGIILARENALGGPLTESEHLELDLHGD